MFAAKEKGLPGLLLSIDFEKAFDSISWSFIEQVLLTFRFGETLIKWIKLFQTKISTCILQNGNLSSYFQVYRGCRQGDPISPYIFYSAQRS